MPDTYTLNADRVPVLASLPEWAIWWEAATRDGLGVVGNWTHKGVNVSTVFLGIDHGFFAGPPMLFETMIFGGRLDESQWRYSTWAEAEAGHMTACHAVRAELDADSGATQ